MCWSGEASLVMTGIGLGGALYSKKTGQPTSIWVSTLYFTLMEFIQALTYPVINQCGTPLNELMTYAGYVHIAFQCFFINWVGLTFVDKKTREKWFKPAMISSSIVAIAFLFVAFYQPVMNVLTTDGWMCGDQTCSIHGNWHIGWMVKISYLKDKLKIFHWYTFTAFILPILYRSWRWSLFHVIVGPIAAMMTTNNRFEIAAIWCLFSIGFITAMKIPFIWNWLNTERLKIDGDER